MVESNSFTSHLVELRSRLLNSLIFIFVIFIISYIFAEQIYNFLVDPYANAVKDSQGSKRLIFTALHETFITYIKVAFFAAIFLGSPVLLIQIYKFIAPGLYKNEKKAILPYLISTPILFANMDNFQIVNIETEAEMNSMTRTPIPNMRMN
mgnify:CR=1 FL=1